MNTSSGAFPHIPAEWSRDSSKTISKNSTTKHVNKQETSMICDDQTATGRASKSTDSVAVEKKRRRIAQPAAAPASAQMDIAENTDCQSSPHESTCMKNSSNQSESPSLSTHRLSDETDIVMRGLFHQVEKLARRPGCAIEEGIFLDSIMTHIPYVEVLQQMFGGSEITDSACVPVVTRAYEESYMREALGAVEQSCIMGTNCECQFIDEHNPFIGVQFTLPVDALSSSNATDQMVEELCSNKLCVLCCRKNTQSLFYEALYNHRAYSACIQLYGNICDHPGEYAKEAMLICPLSGPIHNMPLPIVAHQRNRYTVVVHNGVRQLRQHRVGYEDFHVPSSSRF